MIEQYITVTYWMPKLGNPYYDISNGQIISPFLVSQMTLTKLHRCLGTYSKKIRCTSTAWKFSLDIYNVRTQTDRWWLWWHIKKTCVSHFNFYTWHGNTITTAHRGPPYHPSPTFTREIGLDLVLTQLGKAWIKTLTTTCDPFGLKSTQNRKQQIWCDEGGHEAHRYWPSWVFPPPPLKRRLGYLFLFLLIFLNR